MNRMAMKAVAAAAAVVAIVGLTALPAAAATLNLGARSCSSPYPLVETYTFSSGKTAHLQIGATTKTKTFDNGTNIIHRYFPSSLSSVSASSATTDGAFQATGNGVTCTN
ncbi:hypothetical protein IF188_06410 [Microbacterium sp. NEAU-LLC]|uniref:Uncharacterized protein n=1 Tax=Microbacterium helvum TaxID=2773713 RepID=A0ABR8NP65_9MICO|nr:hypothetical protein [Microbacterium helvum]MBD3941331.1 hypothetical protein [Microbacterium helvum]